VVQAIEKGMADQGLEVPPYSLGKRGRRW
jgi:hypothetical protein